MTAATDHAPAGLHLGTSGATAYMFLRTEGEQGGQRYVRVVALIKVPAAHRPMLARPDWPDHFAMGSLSFAPHLVIGTRALAGMPAEALLTHRPDLAAMLADGAIVLGDDEHSALRLLNLWEA
jgi:hypothetical protein